MRKHQQLIAMLVLAVIALSVALPVISWLLSLSETEWPFVLGVCVGLVVFAVGVLKGMGAARRRWLWFGASGVVGAVLGLATSLITSPPLNTIEFVNKTGQPVEIFAFKGVQWEDEYGFTVGPTVSGGLKKIPVGERFSAGYRSWTPLSRWLWGARLADGTTRCGEWRVGAAASRTQVLEYAEGVGPPQVDRVMREVEYLLEGRELPVTTRLP